MQIEYFGFFRKVYLRLEGTDSYRGYYEVWTAEGGTLIARDESEGVVREAASKHFNQKGNRR
jgi:hypothetical protein